MGDDDEKDSVVRRAVGRLGLKSGHRKTRERPAVERKVGLHALRRRLELLVEAVLRRLLGG